MTGTVVDSAVRPLRCSSGMRDCRDHEGHVRRRAPGQTVVRGTHGKLVAVDDGTPECGLVLVEVPHSDLSKVSVMVLVKVGPVVVLSSGQTTSTWMLAVLADTTVTGRDVAAVLAGLAETGGHLDTEKRMCVSDHRLLIGPTDRLKGTAVGCRVPTLAGGPWPVQSSRVDECEESNMCMWITVSVPRSLHPSVGLPVYTRARFQPGASFSGSFSKANLISRRV